MKTTEILADKNTLVRGAIEKGMTYGQYMSEMESYVKAEASSAPQPSEALSGYTRLNLTRMKRLLKTLKLSEEVVEAVEQINVPRKWLVITESWCGDAAQTMPVMQLLAELNPLIELRIVYRDQNPELMDMFLTNGTRSIPILVDYDTENDEILGHWGPRPSPLNLWVAEEKAAKGGLSPEFKKELQVWYNKDKGVTTFEDLLGLLDHS